MTLAEQIVKCLNFPPYEGEVKDVNISPFDPNTGWLVTTKWMYLFTFKDGIIKYIRQDPKGLNFYDYSTP